MRYTDVGEKRNTPVFFLILFGPLSPSPGGQKRLLRRPRCLLTQPTQQGHKGASSAMLQRRYCCLYDKQITDQKATSWVSLVSKFHCSENSSLTGRFGTKLGLLLSCTYCHAGVGQTGHKVRKDDGSTQSGPGVCCQAGILMTWRSSSNACHGSYYHAGHTATQARQLYAMELEEGHGTVLQMSQAWTDHQGKR